MTKHLHTISLLILLISCAIRVSASNAHWISDVHFQHAANQWYQFRKTFTLANSPTNAYAKIAVDSKYWLWINNQLVVREGGLKRGPSPLDTYVDSVDISSYLCEGKNCIAIEVCYFGKEGFSHKDSKKMGLYFDAHIDHQNIVSNKTWTVRKDNAYQSTNKPFANFRLPETNIQYIASNEISHWNGIDFNDSNWDNAKEVGVEGDKPWNRLVKRPVGMWKDFGLTKIKKIDREGDRIVVELPYNMQFSPWIKLQSPEGKCVKITTNSNYNLNDTPLRAEYITREGEQSYEHLPWLSGEKIYFDVDKDIDVLEVGYRQTGYDTEIDGVFNTQNSKINKLVDKAQKTLYVTMRDSYMDCPDRERAQWIGDWVIEMEESFYSLDNRAIALSDKTIQELIKWQKKDGVLFSPIPAGNWDKELPQQILASIGWYGIREFSVYSGTKSRIYPLAYPVLKRYLNLWNVHENGEVDFRNGGWTFGDWGQNIDRDLCEHAWYYLALKGYADLCNYLGYKEEERVVRGKMTKIKSFVNQYFWTPQGYKSSNYNDEIDDRGNGLMVLAGIANKDQYETITQVLTHVYHASPYIEKYVEEALFLMGKNELALERMQKQYKDMIDSDDSTLWELFQKEGGSSNHAWSGGFMSLLYKYVAGIEPEKEGFKRFHIYPNSAGIGDFECRFSTQEGEIYLKHKESRKGDASDEFIIPKESIGTIRIPCNRYQYKLKGAGKNQLSEKDDDGYRYLSLKGGHYTLEYKDI